MYLLPLYSEENMGKRTVSWSASRFTQTIINLWLHIKDLLKGEGKAIETLFLNGFVVVYSKEERSAYKIKLVLGNNTSLSQI